MEKGMSRDNFIPTPRSIPRQKPKGELPFWEDLNKVTQQVAPWSLFTLMAQAPEVPLRLSIPTTFIFAPNEALVARVTTSLDGKLQITRDSKEIKVTFEMMETNLIDCFNSRTTDHHPYICVIYSATDYKPCFVTKDNFSLLCLYLRVSVGQNVSSFGREEHALATSLFPEKVACVQAYVPLEADERFISVYLYTPVRTLHEVYTRPFYAEACISSYIHEKREPKHSNEFLPLAPTLSTAKEISRRTAAITACLRKHRELSLPGLVCEYVQGVDGNLYMTGVLRVSTPHVRHFSSELREQRKKERLQSARRMRLHGRFDRTDSTGAHDVSGGGGGEVTPRGSATGAGGGNARRAEQERRKKKGEKKEAKGKELQVLVEEQQPPTASTGSSSPSSGGGGGLPGGKEGEARKGDSFLHRLSSGQKIMSIDEFLAHSGSAEQIDALQRDAKKEEEARMEKGRREVYQQLMQQAESLHAAGNFAEAVKVLNQAEEAAAAHVAARQFGKGAKGRAAGMVPNAECFRCGDFVFAELDKPGNGYTHHEWKQQAKLDSKQSQARAKSGSATERRGQRTESLAGFLGKLERFSKASYDESMYQEDEARTPRLHSMCSICLDEMGKDIRNQQMSKGIQSFRSVVAK